jgi:hypothetical protein
MPLRRLAQTQPGPFVGFASRNEARDDSATFRDRDGFTAFVDAIENRQTPGLELRGRDLHVTSLCDQFFAANPDQAAVFAVDTIECLGGSLQRHNSAWSVAADVESN